MNALFGRPAQATPAQPATLQPDLKYWAFLSYSHRDRDWADWLHRRLESYAVPENLVGRTVSAGAVPKRLLPVFRDRDELAASDDLGHSIRTALAASRYLIVLCSPAAATSRWTNEEIAIFKRLHPDGHVLAAIVDGEPFASDMPGREAEECFPPALRRRFGPDGQPTDERAEPIATDFRPHADGKRIGFLKLVAGMLEVGLDELVQREAQRRHRRLTWLTAASLAGMAVTTGLAVAAVQARNEAQEQKREAEGLVGFMLGDLRARLEPHGRLDALDAVGARALAYYQQQDESALTEEGLAQRARALTLIGEIAHLRGDLDGALARYRAALAGTAEALRRAPDDGQRVFDHAQNVFWVGSIAWQRGQRREAEAAFQEYKRLAARLIRLDPLNPRSRLEAVYAETNLGMLLLEDRQFARAAQAFEAALADAERLAAAAPRGRQYHDIVSETLAYLADARRDAGQLEEALASRERQLEVLTRMMAAFGNDAELKRKILVGRQALGYLFAARGDPRAALDHYQAALAIAAELRQIEPDNTEWLQVTSTAQSDLAGLLLALGRTDSAEPLIRASCDIARRLAGRDGSVVEWRFGRAGRCLTLRAEAAAQQGRSGEALAIARQAQALWARHPARDRSAAPPWSLAARLIAGDQEAALGNGAAARSEWEGALASLPRRGRALDDQLQYYLLLKRLGRGPEASRVAFRLDAAGYRHPTYTRTRRTS